MLAVFVVFNAVTAINQGFFRCPFFYFRSVFCFQYKELGYMFFITLFWKRVRRRSSSRKDGKLKFELNLVEIDFELCSKTDSQMMQICEIVSALNRSAGVCLSRTNGEVQRMRCLTS